MRSLLFFSTGKSAFFMASRRVAIVEGLEIATFSTLVFSYQRRYA
ncbi:hypothetical protein [Nostoc sp. T09]|nr:hypothetical protein [Nostoc sp. T09]